jgi:Leu/Phe-tRNA-protein transferase
MPGTRETDRTKVGWYAIHVCMALTPDAIHLSSSLSAPDPASDASLAEGLAALESYKKKDPAKGSFRIHHHHHPVMCFQPRTNWACRVAVVVRFKAVGNAPIMKQNFFRVTVSNHFQAVIQFLRKELGWKAGEPLVSTWVPICVDTFCIPQIFHSVHVYQSRLLPRTR